MKKIYLISVSGGKDSQATWLYMLKKYPNAKLIPYFCDTGWEHELTYKHLDYLKSKLGDLKIIKSKKYEGFEDMCIKRKGFPTRVGRFCTEELKIFPSNGFIKEWQSKGYKVINVVGVRADESLKRSGENKWKTSFLGIIPKFRKYKGSIKPPSKNSLKKFYSKNNSVTTLQPIVNWNNKQVLEFNILQGTKNNPLYSQGASRVGCFLCIQSRVTEIGMLTDEQVKRVQQLEKDVQKVALTTKPVFLHKQKGLLLGIEKYVNRYKYNTLGFDLGCINQFGICE